MAGFERSKARKVETAMDRWNSEWDRPGQRDTGYWLLGVALKNAGCDAGEIADRLDHAAWFSKSKEKGKLRGSVKRIIKNLPERKIGLPQQVDSTVAKFIGLLCQELKHVHIVLV